MEHSITGTKKLTFSAMMAAVYIAVMLLTQGFAFGEFQVRIATSLYALSYLFPFLAVPLALANSLSNVIGGLGILDIVGGLVVGLVVGGAVVAIRAVGLPPWCVFFPVAFGPGLIVPLWLTRIIGVPYWALVASISVGQLTPAVVGCVLIYALSKRKADTL